MLELDEKEFYANANNYYSRFEVCHLLDISNSYLNTLTSKKLIPFIKVGKQIKFLKIWIDEWIRLKAVAVNPNEAINNVQSK